jgi:hypothetical protein
MSYNWTTGLLGLAGAYDQDQRYETLGENAVKMGGDIAQQAMDNTAFQPFTTTTFGGSTSVGADGTTSYNMSPTMANQSAVANQAATQFFNQAAGSYQDRDQSAYDRIRAMQEPGEQRAGTDLESRLAAQGRLGLASSEYGSSPEMFAHQMAINEAKNNAAYQAIGISQQAQAQDASIGTQMQQNAWLPTTMLGNMSNLGLQGAQLAQAGQIAGNSLATQASLTGMEGQINAEQIRAQLMSGLFSSVGGQFQESGTDPLGGLIDACRTETGWW